MNCPDAEYIERGQRGLKPFALTGLFGGPGWEPKGFLTKLLIAPSAAARARAYYLRFAIRSFFAPLFWVIVTTQTIVGFVVPCVYFVATDWSAERRLLCIALIAVNLAMLFYYVRREIVYRANLRRAKNALKNKMVPPVSVLAVPHTYHRSLRPASVSSSSEGAGLSVASTPQLRRAPSRPTRRLPR